MVSAATHATRTPHSFFLFARRAAPPLSRPFPSLPTARAPGLRWDKSGPNVFYVDSDGQRLPGSLFSVGSGSTFAYGVLDTGYSYEMETDAAIDLARRAIFAATHRDAYSGGTVRVYHITAAGWERISEDDSMDLYFKYQAEKEAAAKK